MEIAVESFRETGPGDALGNYKWFAVLRGDKGGRGDEGEIE